ncbi:hypothetical protein [Alcanivorax sp.]|jgi:hypothetical protein|uniref:hypothetical protein n=1 Tax=Alcanivorax sp. TaxID=1872427 RepID=UPI0032D9AA8D
MLISVSFIMIVAPGLFKPAGWQTVDVPMTMLTGPILLNGNAKGVRVEVDVPSQNDQY